MARMRSLLIATLALMALVLGPTTAGARKQTIKKGIWGPVTVDGTSQFPVYKELGVGVYHARLRWVDIAASRPANPLDPVDPAYRWNPELDVALREARRHRMKVAVEVQSVPRWANGGRASNWAPDDPQDFANFMGAAARRYPGVRYWVVWGEPVRQPNFMPLASHTDPGRPLSAAAKEGPHRYARILDASYAAIKRANRRALVVGGNSYTSGDIAPRNFIKNLRLPNGKPPRMDLYGHHPFAARRPDLSENPLRDGMADFCDLDNLVRWIDRNLGRGPNGKKLKLWLGEYQIPSDGFNHEWGWWVSRKTQASWLSSALRITRGWKRIETLNWLGLYDAAPNARGDETHRGLLDAQGHRKPAFRAYKRG